MVRLWDSDVADLRLSQCSFAVWHPLNSENWCQMRPLQELGKCRKAHVWTEYQGSHVYHPWDHDAAILGMRIPAAACKVCSSEVLLPTPTSWWMWHPHCFWVSSQLSVLLCPRRSEQRLTHTRCVVWSRILVMMSSVFYTYHKFMGQHAIRLREKVVLILLWTRFGPTRSAKSAKTSKEIDTLNDNTSLSAGGLAYGLQF